jgi:hypothetical protein
MVMKETKKKLKNKIETNSTSKKPSSIKDANESASPVQENKSSIKADEESTFPIVGIGASAGGNGQWDIPRLRDLLEEICRKNTHFKNFEVDHVFPGIGQKAMSLNARRIYQEGVGTEKILLAIEDITEGKRAQC